MKQAKIIIDRKKNIYIAYLFINGEYNGCIRSFCMEDLGQRLMNEGYNLKCGNIR